MPTIANNSAANVALLNLNRNTEAQQTYLAELSSGSRINQSSDDAAGLAVSDQLQADIVTLEQSGRNTQQGQALLQTADGALSRVSDILQRQQSLITQYNGGTLDATSRSFIEEEYQALSDQIDLIVSSTTFNDVNLIDGSYDQSFLVGTTSDDTIQVDLSSVNVTSDALGLPDTLTQIGDASIFTSSLQTASGAATASTTIADLTGGISGAETGDSFDLTATGLTLSNNTISLEPTQTVGGLVAEINAIVDDEGAQVFVANLSDDGELTITLADSTRIQSGGDISAVGIAFDDADSGGELTVTATTIDRAGSDGIRDDLTVASTVLVDATDAGLDSLQDDLTVIGDAISALSTARSTVGAFTSRLESQAENIDTQILNLTEARSSIVDADIAESQTNFSNAQVLTEAATAALAQANELNASLLTLLR